MAALAGEEGNATAADAQAFAEIMASQYLTIPSESQIHRRKGKYTISGLDAGYYLVKDKDNTLEGSEDSYADYIVKVLGNVEMAPKSDTATSEKRR